MRLLLQNFGLFRPKGNSSNHRDHQEAAYYNFWYVCLFDIDKMQILTRNLFLASDLFDCSKREPGNYPDPLAKRPNCSNRFFTCSTGDLSPIVTYCLPFEDNLFYDPQRNRCDFFDNVFECSGIKRPEITSTSRQTTLFSPATTEIGKTALL